MPTTETKLAWAIEVQVHQLGASLETYDRLQPTISTLRLCNRFGHGEKAAVNTLPVELVQRVEGLLMQEERKKTIEEWAQAFACWKSSCGPIDHYDKDEILDHYNTYHLEVEKWETHDGHCDGCGSEHGQGPVFKPRTKVTSKVRQWVTGFLDDLYLDGMSDGWYETHDRRAEGWCKLVGKPTESSRGRFDKLAKVLERDFGLKLWISHVQEPVTSEYAMDNVTQSTKAYLHLPATSSRKQLWEPVIADYEVDPQRKPTESGSAYAVNFPKTPSKASLARFDRALNILGLKNVSIAKATPRSEAKTSAEDDQPNDQPDGQPDAQPDDQADGQPVDAFFLPRYQPKLTMFVRNCDESGW